MSEKCERGWRLVVSVGRTRRGMSIMCDVQGSMCNDGCIDLLVNDEGMQTMRR